MAKQIQIPDIGSDEVTVTEVMVNVGDSVTADQSIINVEGDKASMEVPAPEAGVVKEILVKVGDKVTTGTPMLVLDSADAASAQAPQAEAPAPQAAPAAAQVVDVNVPDIGGDEVNVTNVMVKVGDRVEVDQSIINVEGDKASMEVPAPVAGIVKEIIIKAGDKVSTGTLIMRFETAGSAPAAAPVASSPAAAPAPTEQAVPQAVPAPTAQASAPAAASSSQADVESAKSYAHATPVIRRLAREFGVNLDKVKGTGRK
ncbi:biotin/lipoyl-containing protein, partial [Aggregatibacter actinomycetemcomitans]